MKLMRIGGDLAKSVFQIHCVDSREKPIWRQRLPCERWLQAIQEKAEPDCEIGLESCGGLVQSLRAPGPAFPENEFAQLHHF